MAAKKDKKPPLATTKRRPATVEIPRTCSRQDLASVLGLSVRSIDELAAKGVFVRTEGRRFDLVLSVNAYCSELREKAAGRASSTGVSLSDERAMTEKVVRQLKERELARLNGEVLDLAELVESWSKFAVMVKQGILSLPSKARGLIPHLTPHDGETLKRACLDLLADLRDEADAIAIGADPNKLDGN